jgi:hypothetical protein
LPRSGEYWSLLTTDADPLYRAVANRVAERVEGISDQTEHLPNSDLLKRVDENVCNHLSHLSLPVRPSQSIRYQKMDPPKPRALLFRA